MLTTIQTGPSPGSSDAGSKKQPPFAISPRIKAWKLRPKSSNSNASSTSSSRSSPRTLQRTTAAADATFLTECSFGVSHDKLLKLLTDVEPYEPYWEALKSIDLAGRQAESLVRMKEFLPSLDEANLCVMLLSKSDMVAL